MPASFAPQGIDEGALNKVLARYSEHVPDKLKKLDELRYTEIPEALAKRKATTPEQAYLSKDEVERLVEWKLKHGTFRPKLLALVASNSATEIESATSSAFSEYAASPSNIAGPLATLTKLKGVGPATASLLLSVYDPLRAPFFSDELFRYLHWEGPGVKGWDRPIKYNAKEYASLVERAREMLDRFSGEDGVSAVRLEKVAYVLGKEETDLSGQIRRKSSSVVAAPSPSDRKPSAEVKSEASRKKPQQNTRTHTSKRKDIGNHGVGTAQQAVPRSKKRKNCE